MMNILYIIIPAYNEEENIKNVMEDWYPIIEKYNGNGNSKLIVIDDGSKDNTYTIMCEYMKTHPALVALTKPNGGHGATVLYGYNYAIEHNTDYIFQTDSDGQTSPDEFEAFWNAKDEYDAILGMRNKRQDGTSRKFVENTLRLILKIVFKVNVPDANAPFRLMKTDLIKKYIKKIPEDYNLPNVMFTTYFKYFNEKLKFIEISFKPRQHGTNSINFKKIFKIGWKAIGDFRFLKRNINTELN